MILRMLADKTENGEYSASEFIDDLQSTLEGLEYGDVHGGMFQIWEYPSGKVSAIISDRELKGERYKSYYGPPDSKLWLPKLKYLRTDKNLVHSEYRRLDRQSERHSLLARLKIFFGVHEKM